MSEPRTALLVDALGLAYRGHFAFARNPLLAPDGRQTSAVFSFLMTILPLLEQYAPAHVAVVFDAPGPTFRDALHAEYKGTRPEMPEELPPQLAIMKQFTEALGLHVLEVPGVEADDVLATLATHAAHTGVHAYIVTSDKDLLQMVGDGVTALAPSRGDQPAQVMDPAAVEAKLGVPPRAVIDYLALVGDTADNVPGVPGIGAKTAAKLLTQFGSLDALYDRLDDVTPERIRTALREHRETALLSRSLITLESDAPVDRDLAACAVVPRDTERLRALCREMGFRGLGARLAPEGAEPEKPAAPTPLPARDAEVLTTSAELDAWLTAATSPVALGLDGHEESSQSVTVQAVALVDAAGREAIVRRDDAVPQVLSRGRVDLAWNVKSLLRTLDDAHLDAAEALADVHLEWAAHGWCDPAAGEPEVETRVRANAAFLSDGGDATAARGAQGALTLGLLTPAHDPAAEHRARTEARRLQEVHREALAALRDAPRLALYRDVERPLVGALVRMERRGVRLDTAACAAMSATLGVDLAALADEIYTLAGARFDILSVPQLRTVLFETLKLPGSRKTKTGYSTDSDVLEELAAEHRIARAILDYRQIQKLRSTYLDALPRMVRPDTGRIHTTYHQIGAATGRLSSSDPNLQNIPIRWQQGREVRRAFIPGEDGWSFIGADYSQIELRLLAHMAGDDALLDAFRRDEDVHRRTASEVAHVPLDEVTPQLRAMAKTVNFAVIYGQSPFGLAKQLGVPLDDARAFIDEFFRVRPRLQQFLAETIAEARQRGYTETLLGRRRYFRDLAAAHQGRRQAAERAAINAPIQGSAADLIKIATVRVDRRLRAERLRAGLVLQVHDELVCEAPPDEVDRVRALLREEMEGALQLDVPLRVDLGVGASWYDIH